MNLIDARFLSTVIKYGRADNWCSTSKEKVTLISPSQKSITSVSEVIKVSRIFNSFSASPPIDLSPTQIIHLYDNLKELSIKVERIRTSLSKSICICIYDWLLRLIGRQAIPDSIQLKNLEQNYQEALQNDLRERLAEDWQSVYAKAEALVNFMNENYNSGLLVSRNMTIFTDWEMKYYEMAKLFNGYAKKTLQLEEARRLRELLIEHARYPAIALNKFSQLKTLAEKAQKQESTDFLEKRQLVEKIVLLHRYLNSEAIQAIGYSTDPLSPPSLSEHENSLLNQFSDLKALLKHSYDIFADNYLNVVEQSSWQSLGDTYNELQKFKKLREEYEKNPNQDSIFNLARIKQLIQKDESY